MPPTTGGAALPLDLLAHVFSFLPPGDAVVVVPRLRKALAAAVAPRVDDVRVDLKGALYWERYGIVTARWSTAFDLFTIPLWALQEAWPQLPERHRVRAAMRAAFHGDVAALRWALPRLADLGAAKAVCEAAMATGQLEALQCALELGCPWDERTCRLAARGGHLAVLQWARAQDPPCPWDEGTCSAAASGGHLAVLQWARAQEPPCPWDEETCRAAVMNGHMAVLQWARAQEPPCPWDERTCSEAAHQGLLAVLQWARAQQPPCPWNEGTCTAAACDGHLAVLQWARAQEPPCPWDVAQCFYAASDRAVLDWIEALPYEDEAL